MIKHSLFATPPHTPPQRRRRGGGPRPAGVSGGAAKEAVRGAASPRTVGASGVVSGCSHPAAGFGPSSPRCGPQRSGRDRTRRFSLTWEGGEGPGLCGKAESFQAPLRDLICGSEHSLPGCPVSCQVQLWLWPSSWRAPSSWMASLGNQPSCISQRAVPK